MKHLMITMALLLSVSAFAAECEFENAVNDKTCTDNDFFVALWNGDTASVEQKLQTNPKLVNSCPVSTSYVNEFVTPLIFASCHSAYNKRIELVSLLLKNGAANQINCQSRFAHLTALKCANAIQDQSVKQAVLKLLKAAGASN